MYVSAMNDRLLRGRSTPAMRAMFLLNQPLAASRQPLALPLLVFRIDADHAHHPAAVDDLALVTNLLYRCPYLHKSCSEARRKRPRPPVPAWSFVAIHNSSAIQIVG